MKRAAIGCALALLGVAHASAQSDRIRVIDPLGGAWLPISIGPVSVPKAAKARLYFTAGIEYAAYVSCGILRGTYSLDGHNVRTRQSDPMDTSMCEDAASARIGKALSRLMSQASTYALQSDGSLRIITRDGQATLFRRFKPVVPALNGRWEVERIGSDVMASNRHVRVHFGGEAVSASAGCNHWNGQVRKTRTGFAVDQSMMTLIGCQPELAEFDGRLFGAVRNTHRHVVLPGNRVRLEGLGEPLTLRRPPATSTSLPGVYRACGSNLRGIGYNGVPAVAFTTTTVRDSAGCTGTYRTNGALLDIKRDESRICSTPPAASNDFVELEIGDRGSILALLRPDGYAFDEEGVLRLRTRRGVLNLCRDGERRPLGS